jgi:hypothetical protein
MRHTFILIALMVATGCGKKAVKQEGKIPEVPPFLGYATYFDNMGIPYGACGLSDATIDSQDYVALNVQNTPGDYRTFLPRPIQDKAKIGLYENGLNCGRWIRVTLGRNCKGDAVDGSPGKAFCSKGTLENTAYTGATLDMIVADSCQDGNSFCRDSYGHLDLHTSSLSNFRLYGKKVDPLKVGWNNPEVTWRFIKAPAYQGDIKIAFVQGSTPLWPTVVISHLENGISVLEVKTQKGWVQAKRQGDNGLIFNLPTDLVRPYTVRAYDYDGQPIKEKKEYRFDFPCDTRCEVQTEVIRYL